MFKRFLNYLRWIFKNETPTVVECAPDEHKIVFDRDDDPFGDDEDSEIIMGTPFVGAPISDCAGSVRCREQ